MTNTNCFLCEKWKNKKEKSFIMFWNVLILKKNNKFIH
jgi:hypothetical protein